MGHARQRPGARHPPMARHSLLTRASPAADRDRRLPSAKRTPHLRAIAAPMQTSPATIPRGPLKNGYRHAGTREFHDRSGLVRRASPRWLAIPRLVHIARLHSALPRAGAGRAAGRSIFAAEQAQPAKARPKVPAIVGRGARQAQRAENAEETGTVTLGRAGRGAPEAAPGKPVFAPERSRARSPRAGARGSDRAARGTVHGRLDVWRTPGTSRRATRLEGDGGFRSRPRPQSTLHLPRS